MYFLQTADLDEDLSVLDLEPEPTDRMRMLIVDDDAADRYRIRRMANSLDVPIQLDEAASLDALSAQLDSAKFDIILLDYQLGAHDGVDAIRAIRRHRMNANTPVVMVAGREDIETAVLSLKSGADNYLSKGSLSVQLLSNAVMEVLDKTGRDNPQDSSIERRAVAEAILAEVSRLCFERMRPVLTRILRQVRVATRADHRIVDLQVAKCLQDIEGSCQTLWDYFEEFDDFRKSGLLSQEEPR